MLKVYYNETYSVYTNGKWANRTESKLVTFVPITTFGEPDLRPIDEILKQTLVYGKALIGSCGGNPVWEYKQYKRVDIKT